MSGLNSITQPEPQGPTDEDLLALAQELDDLPVQAPFAFARAVLERWSRPAIEPVPVSERPWEREGWCDAKGRCWLYGKVEGDWRLINPLNCGVPRLEYCFSNSLPHWALPLPQQEEVK
jgi:hypothetical protein